MSNIINFEPRKAPSEPSIRDDLVNYLNSQLPQNGVNHREVVERVADDFMAAYGRLDASFKFEFRPGEMSVSNERERHLLERWNQMHVEAMTAQLYKIRAEVVGALFQAATQSCLASILRK